MKGVEGRYHYENHSFSQCSLRERKEADISGLFSIGREEEREEREEKKRKR